MMQMNQWQKAFRTTLLEEFQSRQSKNPRYSLRSFARSLQTSPATLSLILRGAEQWNLSSKLALNILELAKVPETTKSWLQKKMGEAGESSRSTLGENHYDLLTSWLNSVVYTFLELPVVQRSAESISAKTKIPLNVIQGTLDLLLDRGLISRDEEGQLHQKTPDINAGDGQPNAKVRAHHSDSLQLAQLALDKIEAERRDFTTQTFVGRMETLAQVKKEIRDFHARIAAIMDEGAENDQVFRMTVALFPFDFQEETAR
jgi:uncharacterized protein (TIGR02147 family)